MGLLLLGIGIGIGVGTYRHLPPMSEQSLAFVVGVMALVVVLAWFAGKRFSQSQWQQQMQAQQQIQDQEQKQAQEQRVVVNVAGPGSPRSGEGPAVHVLSSPPASLQEASQAALGEQMASGVPEPSMPRVRVTEDR